MKQVLLLITLLFTSVGFYRNYCRTYIINDAIVGGLSYGILAMIGLLYLNIVFRWCLI